LEGMANVRKKAIAMVQMGGGIFPTERTAGKEKS